MQRSKALISVTPSLVFQTGFVLLGAVIILTAAMLVDVEGSELLAFGEEQELKDF